MGYLIKKKLAAATFALLIIVSAFCGCKSRGTSADIIPDRTDSLFYARGLKISYYRDFTLVTLRDPWDTLKTRKEYILSSKTLLEERPGLKDSLAKMGTVIATPVEKVVIYTSVHAAMAEQLGLLDRISGVCEPEYITSSEILKRIDNKQIADLGNSASPNIEKIISINAEAIIASPFENSGYGAAEKLGIPIIEAADYMENHPLGRTEWVKFYGLLFGCRNTADSLFEATRTRYEDLFVRCAVTSYHPSVILERKWGQTWAVPANGSYVGQLHRDAGAQYVFSEITSSNSVHKSFEEVFERGCDADFWLMKYGSKETMTYKDLEREYQPYADFKAFKCHNIYTCNTLVTTYYDDITLHPDRILADLIYIYHPEILPDHRLQYYFSLKD